MKSLTSSLVYFGITVALAFWQRWSATDIAWSMWFASLTTGYLLILCGIFGPVPGRRRGIGKWLPDLIFFTIHFGFFHFVHSQILATILPLDGDNHGIGHLVAECARRYWLFVVIALLNLWPTVQRSWGTGSRLRFDEPYKAVIRNHVTILAVAVAAQFVDQQQILYVLLVFYFLPFSQLKALFTRRTTASG